MRPERPEQIKVRRPTLPTGRVDIASIAGRADGRRPAAAPAPLDRDAVIERARELAAARRRRG